MQCIKNVPGWCVLVGFNFTATNCWGCLSYFIYCSLLQYITFSNVTCCSILSIIFILFIIEEFNELFKTVCDHAFSSKYVRFLKTLYSFRWRRNMSTFSSSQTFNITLFRVTVHIRGFKDAIMSPWSRGLTTYTCENKDVRSLTLSDIQVTICLL